jgi:dipeptidyl aminopeptidase/acylaminoacyl peptidase
MADLAWLPDGKGLIASAFDPATLQDGQLWKIGFPDGRVARITSDASFYAATSVSADGASIAAARFRQELDLWITTPADARMARQVTFGSGEGSVENWDEGPDSTIVYSTVKDGIPQIISVRQDGASERSLTQGQKIAIEPKFRPGVGIIYRHADDDLTLHIWRMDATGENARSLTSGTGESLGDVSRDGRVILLYRDDMRDVVWTLSPDGGAPVRRGVSTFNSAVLSPDGTRVLSTLIHEVQGQGAFTPQIISLQSGETSTPGLPPRANDAAWTPDGTAITYLHDSNERRNLYLLPLDGGAPREITHFKDGRIQLHRWSPDGKRLVVRRKIGNADNLWVVGADGSNPVAVTNFETGSIGDMKWSRDGTRILFTYGLTTQNVVLIRNFSGRS